MLDERDGQVIKGYELEELIGQGGFGAVYRARQSVIQREVAIKIILPRYANQPEFIRRFETEAQLVARLEHLHIVPLYDYWRDPNGAYLVMRWLRGGSLKESLRAGQWEIKPIIRLMSQVTAALHTAHAAGVVHRDIKPANIFLDDDANAYLGDFGIARTQTTPEAEKEGQKLVLSPAYVAPELINEDVISPQSDIYSLGLLLYEMLTGRHPYESRKTPLAMLRAQIYDPLPPLSDLRPDLPDDLSDVVARATAKNPDERYPDVLFFDRAFRRALRAESRPIQLDGLSESAVFPNLDSQLTPLEALLEPENPYRGLRAFQGADNAYFFGRESLTEQLLARMQAPSEGRFIAVVGPSGSGKSSVVRAGLIPALRKGGVAGSDKWFYIEMLPGYHPMEELEAGLLSIAQNPPPSLLEQLTSDTRGLLRAVKRVLPRDEGSQLVLFIDQFEEIFTLVKDPVERTLFLQNLVEAVQDPASDLRVVITLRADFYDRPLFHPTFGDLVRRFTEVVLPLTPEELERTIVAPLQKVGVGIDAPLVAAMVAEVNQEPGALPLLQYALTELFDRRDDKRLTLAAYNEIGGVMGALAGRADELYRQLEPEGRAVAQQLFLRLVTLGEGTEDTRRRAPLEELLSLSENPATMQNIIDLFGKYRLLTFDRDPITRLATVEVAHEALLRTWGQMRTWLEAGRDDIRQQRRLATLTAEWAAAGQDDSFLLRGARLEEIQRWAAGTSLALTADEMVFLGVSLRQREVEQQAERTRQEREAALEQQSRRRLRFLAGFMAAATVLAMALSLFAFNQRRDAELERGIAQSERDRAENARLDAENARSTSDANVLLAETQAAIAERRADEVQSLSLVGHAQQAFGQQDIDLALALALEAVDIPNPPEQAIRFLNDLAHQPGTRRQYTTPDQTPVLRAVALPDSALVITSEGQLTDPAAVRMWDIQTGEEVGRFGGHEAAVVGLVLTPDGKRLLTASLDGTFRVWVVDSQKEVARYAMETNETLAAVETDLSGAAYLGSFLDSLIAISPDGRRFLSVSQDGVLRQRDLATGEIIHRLRGHRGAISTVVYDPQNTERAVSGDVIGRIVLWDLVEGRAMTSYSRPTGGINVLAISPDGTHILYNGDGGDLNYADLESAQVLFTLSAHNEPVTALAFNRGGEQVVSAGRDGQVTVWDLMSETPKPILHGHGAAITDVLFMGVGSVLSADNHGEIRLWDLAGNITQIERQPVDGGAFSLTVSFDGQLLVTGSGSRIVYPNGDAPFTGLTLWNVGETLTSIAALEGHTDEVVSVAFTPVAVMPGGLHFASGSRDGTLRMWHMTNEGTEELWKVEGITSPFFRLVFLNDGTGVLSGGFGNEARLYDAYSGALVRAFGGDAGHQAPVMAVAVSPDGGQALTGAQDGEIILWDIATGDILARWHDHTGAVSSLSFSPSGALALSSSFDKSVIVWRVDSGDVLARLTGHNSEVLRAAFRVSPQQATNPQITRGPDTSSAIPQIVSVGFDGAALLWDVNTVNREGRIIERLGPERTTITDLALSPLGERLYLASDSLYAWGLPPQRTLQAASAWLRENRYVRELTCDERQQFLAEAC